MLIRLGFDIQFEVPSPVAMIALFHVHVPSIDFSSWFEVYLRDRWRAFDARNNKPRIGRVLMARGRDAADVAITTSFGTTWLKSFAVVCDAAAAGKPVVA
jgi:hypothetical protein